MKNEENEKKLIHSTAIVDESTIIGSNVSIGAYSIIYPNVILGDNVSVGPYCIIGEPKASYYSDREGHVFEKTIIGSNSVIRSNTIIYEGNSIGNSFNSGHHVSIRENNVIGDSCSIGTMSDIQGNTKIGNFVRIHSNVFVAPLTTIMDYAWLFPHAVVTNDVYPPLNRLKGCTISKYAIVSAGSIILPGVNVGENALVAAGAVVSKDVKKEMLVLGIPAKERCNVRDIKDEDFGNQLYPWKDYLEDYRGYPWQKM